MNVIKNIQYQDFSFLLLQQVTKELNEASELLKEETDKEMIKLIQEDIDRLNGEKEEIIEEANQISLPSNL